MSKKLRRFEVLLPLKFNDGRDIPDELRVEALREIVEHFGAVSYETQIIEGHWRHRGVLYRDDLARVVVDLPETAKNREWMRAFRKKWKKRLQQLELWMVSWRIEIEEDDD